VKPKIAKIGMSTLIRAPSADAKPGYNLSS
jgi:hypothetical protein